MKTVCEKYSDFGPTLAAEYLKKNHEIHISSETLRLWMVEIHLWIPKKIKRNLHPMRTRRSLFGELEEIDGSHHYWFEDRAAPCVLMVMVDDATSAITSLHFAETENLEAYMSTFSNHLNSYGIPLALYGDKCSVLTSRSPKIKDFTTQFGFMLKELDCELILAHSPQAKGKVERANRTLQDRLVKYLRMKNINTIEEGNHLLEEYRKEHNEHFSKKPKEQMNAHRPLEGICLENVLCIRETRTLSKDNVLQFQNTFYKICNQEKLVPLFKGTKVEIRKLRNGTIKGYVRGKEVKMAALMEIESLIKDEKQMQEWKSRNQYIPPNTHPYKRGFNEELSRKVV